MEKTERFITVLAVVATLAFGAWLTVRIVKDVQFDLNCTQFLKRAANASTIDLAKEDLSKAISYAEKKHLTEGVVSILFHQPKNDVGYWYQNMLQAYSELDNLSENASSLEKSNVLMRVREALTDQTDSGVSVTVPDGIEIYPHNVAYFWWMLISLILSVIFWMAEWMSYNW